MSAIISVNDFISAGPETLAGKFLRRFWQPVYCAHEILPARAVPIRVLGENFTLYRGETELHTSWATDALTEELNCRWVGSREIPFAAFIMAGNTMPRGSAWSSPQNPSRLPPTCTSRAILCRNISA